MRKHIFACLLALCACPLIATDSATSLRLRLTLEPADILVGEPTAMRIDVDNDEQAGKTLPSVFFVELSRGKDRFLTQTWAGDAASEHHLEGDYSEQDRLVPARGHATFYVPVDEQILSPVMDSRLNVPGDYGVTVVFASHPAGYAPQATSADALPTTFGPLLTSNVARLTVLAPTGSDAEIWQMIVASSKGNAPNSVSHAAGWNSLLAVDRARIAAQIRASHPASRYALTFGAYLEATAPQSERDSVLAVLEKRAPRGPVVDWYRLHSAGQHVSRQSAYLLKDPTVALGEVDRIQQAYRDVIERGSNDLAIRTARVALSDSMTRMELLDYIARINAAAQPSDAQRVIPVVDCVKSGDDGLAILFGYYNPNRIAVAIMVGDQNHFEPGPANQGQPVTFQPGKHDAVFRIPLKERTNYAGLKWVLDGTTTMVPADLQKCTDDD